MHIRPRYVASEAYHFSPDRPLMPDVLKTIVNRLTPHAFSNSCTHARILFTKVELNRIQRIDLSIAVSY